MNFRSIVTAAKILWQESDWAFYWPIICKFESTAFVKESPRSDVASYTYEVPHFPGLYVAGLLLSRENYSQLKAGALFDCPAVCCECGQPAQERMEVRTQPERGSRIRLKLSEVPVCERCRIKQTDRSAPLLVKTKYEGGKLHSLLLVARSREFLNETFRRNDAGELLPPWFWRPDDDITYMRRAFVLHSCWWKMFREFNAAQREEYLRVWPASEAWQAWIILATR